MGRRASASLVGVWLIWLAATGSAAAQPAERPAALDLTTASGERAVAVDPAAGTIVIGGGEMSDIAGCGLVARAFIASLGSDGKELWRRDADTLFAAAAGFTPEHVLASMVRAVAVEPATGRIFALGEAHFGWQGGACLGGIATERAPFVVALDAAGAPLAGTMLGDAPAGPPPHQMACGALCPATSPATAGLGIALDSNGDVLVTSRRHNGEETTTLESAFIIQRLDRDLEPVAAPTTVPDKLVSCGVPTGNLIRVEPLQGTHQIGSVMGMAAVGDGCSTQWMFDNSGGVYGFEAEYQISVDPNITELVFDLDLDYQGGKARFDFYLLRNDGGQDLISSRTTGIDGRLDTAIHGAITTDQPWDYLDPLTGKVISQVMITGLIEHTIPGQPNCEDTHGDYGGGWGR